MLDLDIKKFSLTDSTDTIKSLYGGKTRIRVCGICLQNESILLIKHEGIGVTGELWVPPGGGIEYGEPAEKALKREFREECNVEIKVKKLLFINEFIQKPLHAIELFFEVQLLSGKIKKGMDPEFNKEHQIINEVSFVTFNELNLLPDNKKHGILRGEISSEILLNMFGYFKLSQ